MSIKLRLQSISDWVTNFSKVAKGTVKFSVESGLLQDSLKDLCDQGGVAGAVFKLGAMALPEADAEQRIAAMLGRTLLKTVDSELKKRPHLIKTDTWRTYRKKELERIAKEALSANFTWLQVFGAGGRKASRSWPIVAELADFTRSWVWGAAKIDNGDKREIAQEADDIRGIVHDALAKSVDTLLVDDVVRRALDEEAPLAVRDALVLLAEQLSTLKSTHLFGEVPQNALYVSPTIKLADYGKVGVIQDWKNIYAKANGDDGLFELVHESSGLSRVIVIEGEMGVGKSCLMRMLASRLSAQFCRDRKQPVIFSRWRDIYDESDLIEGIKSQLHAQYRLPFHDLETHDNLVFLIDGFDEMRSHEAAFVASCFDRLVKLAKQRNSTVIVAMRSAIVSESIRNRWKDEDAVVVQVQEFDDAAVDEWSTNWQEARNVSEPSGEKLRAMCGSAKELVHNPLLLFMLARYVHPVASQQEEPLSRAEIFRVFVDETIEGKARQSGEAFPFAVRDEYRLLLQEIAWIASWPNNGGKCPEGEIRDRFRDIIKNDFKFDDVRTAFVLHFFEPGQVSNEFEFHPEGFRHYLLAEWCVRANLEALIYEDEPGHRLARQRDDAMNALAQFSLREVERELVNEVYEQLPRLAEECRPGENDAYRLEAFGVTVKTDKARKLVQDLYARVQRQSESPKHHRWLPDSKVGIPEGHQIPPCMNDSRLLVNYWDHCLLAAFGLYRGMRKDVNSEPLFNKDKRSLGRFLDMRDAHWGVTRSAGFNLSRLNLEQVDFRGMRLAEVDFRGSNLRGANLDGATLVDADLRNAILLSSTFHGANMLGTRFDTAIVRAAEALKHRGAILPYELYTVTDAKEDPAESNPRLGSQAKHGKTEFAPIRDTNTWLVASIPQRPDLTPEVDTIHPRMSARE